MEEGPIVRVKQGRLRGSLGSLPGGGRYYSFKGIPYAAPPVGHLRFKAPVAASRWRGERDASSHGAMCPQFDMTMMQLSEGSEDCLYLNVYSKSLSSSSPVMVFIHGGGFMSGAGDDAQYGPRFLLEHDVTLVTINYRLEVFGFLALDTPEVPGNAGLKDQVLALKWVKDNIKQFGGDSNNVTIFGESAGSASVTYHLLSPLSKGLFHRAIAQSGTCLNDWAVASEPQARAFRIAKVLGKDISDTNELLKFLQSVPAADLVKMTFKTATEDEKRRGLSLHFVPNIEKKFRNVQAFISENPIDLLLARKVNDVPLMIGYNSAEGMLTFQATLRKAKFLNENPSYLVPREIARNVSQSKMDEFGKRIIEFYTNNKGFTKDNVGDLIDMATDVHFGYQTHRFVHFYNACKAPIYLYRFEFETELNLIKNLLGLREMRGACHADDLFYLFSGVLNQDLFEEHKEKLGPIVHSLTQLWTNFAKTGEPTSGGHWPRWSAARQQYAALTEGFPVGSRADGLRVAFWDKLHLGAGLPAPAASSL